MKKYIVRKVYQVVEQESMEIVDQFGDKERAVAQAQSANAELAERNQLA